MQKGQDVSFDLAIPKENTDGDSKFNFANKNQDMLSVSLFADEAQITPQAVRKMIVEGRLSAKKVGEQYIIDREELKQYLLKK